MSQALVLIRRALGKKLNDQDRLQLGVFARRAGAPQLSLGILRPLIYESEHELRSTRDPEHDLQYGASLLVVGARRDALDFLVKVPPERHPQAEMHIGFAAMQEWRYADALRIFRRYAKRLKGQPYPRLVANFNIAICLSFLGKFDACAKLLMPILSRSRRSGFFFLWQAATELLIQVLLFSGDAVKARAILDEFDRALVANAIEVSPQLGIFFSKWRALVAFLLDQDREGAIRLFQLIRTTSSDRQFFENVRDCDLYVAWLRGDERLLKELLFFAPSTSFHNKVLRLVGRDIEVPDVLEFHVDGAGEPPGEAPRVFDLETGSSVLRRRSLGLRLVAFLARDRYRPRNIGEVFDHVFASESFNPDSSPDKIKKLVRRTNLAFEGAGVSLKIERRRNFFSLEGEARLRMRHPSSLAAPAHLDSHTRDLLRYASLLPTRPFLRQEAEDIFGVSKSEAHRLLAALIDAGFLKQEGSGRATRYQFETIRKAG